MKEELKEALELIYEGLGEWDSINAIYCPEWTQPFKTAAEIIDMLYDSFDINVYKNIREEIEKRFINGAIEKAESSDDGALFEVGRRKYLGKMYQVFVTVKELKDEMPKMTCPKCGKLYDDFDGLSFSHCPACGYCSHPNSEVIDGREICGICGREIKKDVRHESFKR
jgi:hypothetical protein